MSKLSSLSYTLLFSVVVALSGCGGGGGGGSNPSPAVSSAAPSSTPSSGSSFSSNSSSSSAPTSTPANTQLTIQGKVAADALAGGEVVFTIGSNSYKTNVDDALKYSIQLDVPAQNIYMPFAAIATGSASDSWVQLAASFPSINALVAKAGSDKVLSEDEFFGVNISVLTTAQYAEITTSNSAINTDEARKDALLETHPIRALEKAAMLSRVISDIDVDLPKPATTTLGFLLDANLSETYYEILRLSNFSKLKARINLLKEDTAVTNVSAAKLSGVYFLEALNSQYELTFNDDGTGKLHAGSINGIYRDRNGNNVATVAFSWVRKAKQIKIQFSQPVKYLADDYRPPENGMVFSCDDYSTVVYEYCDMTFDSLQLDLVSETEFTKLAELQINGEVSRGGTILYNGSLSSEFARLTSADNAVEIAASNLIGFEWFTDQYSYIFMENGTGKQTDLGTKTEYSFNWEVKNNSVAIDGVSLWPINKTAVGYTLFYVDTNRVNRTLMVKRTPVVMAESDWIGRWTGSPLNIFANAHDVNANKTWNDGFESEVAGSWSLIDDHRQTAVSNAIWRMDRDVLAIHDGKYYMSQCHGVQIDSSSAFYPNCFIAVATRAKDFDTNVFWGVWSYPAFNEKNTGDAWFSSGGNVFSSDSSLQLMHKSYSRVSATKLFSRDDDTILEMTAATKHEIELCEYKIYEQCLEGNKRRYERGVQVKISANTNYGGLYIDYNATGVGGTYVTTYRHVDEAIMLPKNRVQVIRLSPSTGYTVRSENISGCDGVLNGLNYEIPARTTNCELKVTFTPVL